MSKGHDHVMRAISQEERAIEFVVPDVMTGLRQYLKNQGFNVYENHDVMSAIIRCERKILEAAQPRILEQRGVDSNGVLEVQR